MNSPTFSWLTLNKNPQNSARIDAPESKVQQAEKIRITPAQAIQLLKAKLAQSNQTIAELREELHESDHEIEIANELIAELSEQITEQRQAGATNGSQRANLGRLNPELEQQLALANDQRIEQQLNAANEVISNLEMQVQRVVERLQEEQEANLSLHISNQNKLLQIRGLEYDIQQVAGLKMENERLEQETGLLQNQKESAVREQQRMADRLAHSLQEREMLQAQKARLEQMLTTLTHQLKSNLIHTARPGEPACDSNPGSCP